MKKLKFNNGWRYGEGQATALEVLFSKTAGAELLIPERDVTLPHDAMIETPRRDHYAGATTGFWDPKNIYYTKTFTLDPEDAGKRVWIEFEGVFQFAFIYLNNQYVGRWMYGYSNFYMDLTEFLNPAGENHLKVAVRNGCDSSRWYSGAGIYRDVWLHIGDALHVKCEGTRVYTEQLEEGFARLAVTVPVEYNGAGRRNVRILNEILDADGAVVWAESVPLTVVKACEPEIPARVSLMNPHPWSLEDPYLYRIRTSILENGSCIDCWEGRFGIRVLDLDPVHGLRLNGETVRLKGSCLHHDNGVVGTATFRESEERRLRRIKAAGYNALRSGAHPFAKCVLDVCDEIGILVYDEAFDVWMLPKVAFDYAMNFETSWEADVTNLVLRDYNHPCVIFYGLGCEILELKHPYGKDLTRRMAAKFKQLDPSRFTAMSMNPQMVCLEDMPRIGRELGMKHIWGNPEKLPQFPEADTGQDPAFIKANSEMSQLTDYLDWLWYHPDASSASEEAMVYVDAVGYSYAPGLYEADHEKYPSRIMFGSESYPKYLTRCWEQTEKHPYVIGDFAWSAWDYLGESGIGQIEHTEKKTAGGFYMNYPGRTAMTGLFDLIGDPMPMLFWRAVVWGDRTAPYIAVRPPEYYGEPKHPKGWSWISDPVCGWNWPGFEGKPIQIEVYTKAEWVELFVNGRSLGRAKPGGIFPWVAFFETSYEPGELKAVDANGEEFVIRSAEDESCLKADQDPRELADTSREITHIEISICDKNGVLNTASSKKVTMEVTGGGVQQGFGTADFLSEENFYDTEVSAYHGRLLAVVRRDGSGEPILVKLTAEGCASVELEIPTA